MSETALPDEAPEAAEPDAGAVTEVELPLIRLELAGATLNVARNPSGDRAIIVGPILLQVIIPLGPDAARSIGRELTGGIEIATALPAGVRIKPQ